MSRAVLRGSAGLLVASVLAFGGVRPAAALGELWTLLALPLNATAGQMTTFTLTATNLLVLNDVGCLEVDLPASFQSVSAEIVSGPDGKWRRDVTGNNVVIYSENGGGRLELTQSVTFTITARPTVSGAFGWANHAHERQDCGGPDLPGIALGVTVLPQLVPTPTPTPLPTAVSTVAPTPAPTAAPTPTRPATPVPTATPHEGTPRPAPSAPSTVEATPQPSDRSERPSPSGSPAAASPSPSASPAGAPAPVGGSSPPSQVIVPRSSGIASIPIERAGVSIDLASFDAGAQTWAVLGLTLGLPGIIFVWIALQTLGALAWIPAMRRLRGDDEEAA